MSVLSWDVKVHCWGVFQWQVKHYLVKSLLVDSPNCKEPPPLGKFCSLPRKEMWRLGCGSSQFTFLQLSISTAILLSLPSLGSLAEMTEKVLCPMGAMDHSDVPSETHWCLDHRKTLGEEQISSFMYWWLPWQGSWIFQYLWTYRLFLSFPFGWLLFLFGPYLSWLAFPILE